MKIEKLLDYQIEQLLSIKNPSESELEQIVKIYIQKMKDETSIKRLMLQIGQESTERPQWFKDVDFD